MQDTERAECGEISARAENTSLAILRGERGRGKRMRKDGYVRFRNIRGNGRSGIARGRSRTNF